MKKDFELNLSPGIIKTAMREADAGKADMYWAPRESIRIIAGFNPRVMDDDYEAHIAHIGGLILANGFDKTCALKAYISKEGEKHIVNVYDGHTRLLATDWANERGAAIEKLPILTAPAGTTMEDLTIGLITSNSGKQLTPFEKGVVCKRLMGMGLDEAEIARRLDFTKAYVMDLLLLQGSDKKIRDMVTTGGVSASTAVDAIKTHGAGAADLLGGKLETAKAAGKTRVTKKDIAPKRNLLDDGIKWIKAEGWCEAAQDQKLAGLLSHLTGAPIADVTTRLNAS